MIGASQARGFYVIQYQKLLKRYAGRDDQDKRARAVALEMTITKFGKDKAKSAQSDYHKEAPKCPRSSLSLSRFVGKSGT